mmetsp:Transcript_31735/g.62129  ORF Transcript_31735/g.62129 Transcript_31735/m.62129 type:complete len:243 (+) Transcript_31735:876-1604(+)
MLWTGGNTFYIHREDRVPASLRLAHLAKHLNLWVDAARRLLLLLLLRLLTVDGDGGVILSLMVRNRSTHLSHMWRLAVSLLNAQASHPVDDIVLLNLMLVSILIVCNHVLRHVSSVVDVRLPVSLILRTVSTSVVAMAATVRSTAMPASPMGSSPCCRRCTAGGFRTHGFWFWLFFRRLSVRFVVFTRWLLRFGFLLYFLRFNSLLFWCVLGLWGRLCLLCVSPLVFSEHRGVRNFLGRHSG